jgi:hypothetical protein
VLFREIVDACAARHERDTVVKARAILAIRVKATKFLADDDVGVAPVLIARNMQRLFTKLYAGVELLNVLLSLNFELRVAVRIFAELATARTFPQKLLTFTQSSPLP